MYSSLKQFLAEGGNVRIGDTSAAEIKITPGNRKKVSGDIHEMLSAVHDSFHKAHGVNLFGIKKGALDSGKVYSGSTEHLMNPKLSHAEFAKHKPTVGDIDVKVPREHYDNLHAHMEAGKKFGKYTVVGAKKSGSESHVLMRHENGQVHQVDLEQSDYHNGEPSDYEHFAHSANWEDAKNGVKGVHHKFLLNCAGGESHKFAVAKGLKERSAAPAEEGMKDTKQITHTLFGKDADESKIHSFSGLCELVKKHKTPAEHRAIYDKFVSSTQAKKNINHGAAIDILAKHLNIKQDNVMSEEINEGLGRYSHLQGSHPQEVGHLSKGDFKRREMEHELKHETKPLSWNNSKSPRLRPPVKTQSKASGMVYHSGGTKVDKNGKSYDFHYGTKEAGQAKAAANGGKYSHFKSLNEFVTEAEECKAKSKSKVDVVTINPDTEEQEINKGT